MRIALSGAHAVGKSTLVAELHRTLATHQVLDEPYYELSAQGVVFAERPCVDDYLMQLERSIVRLTADRAPDVLYDRCPADFLAYLAAVGADELVRDWLSAAGEALRTLDLIVFVPIEKPDRIVQVSVSRLRRHVDAILRDILLEDSYGFDLPIIAVHGSESARARQLVAALRQRGVQT